MLERGTFNTKKLIIKFNDETFEKHSYSYLINCANLMNYFMYTHRFFHTISQRFYKIPKIPSGYNWNQSKCLYK